MKLAKSILATLAYHDIFDYPLTTDQIHRYLIRGKTSLKTVDKILATLLKQKKIIQYSSSESSLIESNSITTLDVARRIEKFSTGSNSNILFALFGRQNLFPLRIRREKYSKSKFKRTHFFAKVLKIIPTLKLVAISGALAMQNSHNNDDIDLVLVTSRGTLWTTRFFASILLMPYKRDPQGAKVSNRACLNVFLDESDLKISPQNLYLAHEIYQMKPIWDRDGTYQRFINANKWVKKYLPNWQLEEIVNGKWKMVNGKSKKSVHSLFTINYLPIENLLRDFQLWYIRSKITTERITEHQLFFHPQNTGEWVMREYQKRLRKLKILN